MNDNDRPYLERLRELTTALSQEQDPLRRNEILERMLFLIHAQASTPEAGKQAPDPGLSAPKPEPDTDAEPDD